MPTTTARPDGLVDVYYDTKEVAQLVREALKGAFPGHTFSVRGEHFAGGSAVNVRWTDGPTDKEVENLVKQYQGSTFDGMIDLKSYVTREVGNQRIHYGPDYVTTSRDISPDLMRACCEEIGRKYGVPAPRVVEHSYTWKGQKQMTYSIDRDSGEPLSRYGDGSVADYNSKPGDLAWQLCHQTSTYARQTPPEPPTPPQKPSKPTLTLVPAAAAPDEPQDVPDPNPPFRISSLVHHGTLDERTNYCLQTIINQRKADMFTRTIPDMDEQALGILIAHWAGWDCRRVALVCIAALEDANMHTETEVLVEACRKMGALDASDFADDAQEG